MEEIGLKIIARLYSDFETKFALPRQSGSTEHISVIRFEPEFRNKDAVRGLEGFSHLWLVWHFSEIGEHAWSPTVRPPRLGGNRRVGVFASRSPFRPNPVGLSSVEIDRIDLSAPAAPLIYVRGADLMNGTPIFDIKPYLPFSDAHPEASGGYAETRKEYSIGVRWMPDTKEALSESERKTLEAVLSQDPRPAYHEDEREYGFFFAGREISFYVRDGAAIVTSVRKREHNDNS